MRYETELMKLMPVLESYLLKIKSDYDNLIDMDDLYQECLLNAVESSEKKEIQDPRNYFIGVFNNTIKKESEKRIREFQQMNRIPVVEYTQAGSVGMIEAIDMHVKSMKPATRRVWSCLKSFYGNSSMVSKATGFGQRTIQIHKKKLKDVYCTVRDN